MSLGSGWHRRRVGSFPWERRRSVVACALLASVLVACDAQTGPGAAGTGALAGFGAGGAAGSSGAAGFGGSGGMLGPIAGANGRAALGASPLPCEVAEILKLRCQSCHAAAPLAGVPMSLLSWEDLSAPAVTRSELTVHALAAMRVHDAVRPMPPDRPLPAEELAVLDGWFAAGAPIGTDPSCEPEPPTPDGGLPPDDGPPADSTCYTLRAHGASQPGDTTPYTVSNQHYACFYFDMPWADGAQGVYFGSEFDEHPELVHHWVMYLDQAGNQPDGFVESCTGLHPSSPTMVAGWAPGSDNNDLPPDVGMHLSPPNRKVFVEFHFFHDGVSPPVQTTSGVKICTANQPRANTATISLLGTELISVPPKATGTASGTCIPQYNGEIHVVRSWPHMHQIGTGMKTEVFFANGTTQMLGPWKFDFNSQVSYPTPLLLNPGDRLVTTCEYLNPGDATVTTGTASESEMCFNFVTAYPAGALASKNILGGSSSATSSATACLQ